MSGWSTPAASSPSFPPTCRSRRAIPFLAQRPGGDLLGDAVRAAHERGLHLVARMDFSKVQQRIAAEHPEWCYVSPTGQSQAVSDLVSVCPSGAYYQEKSFAALDEVMDRYPVDGFFFNWFGFNEIDYSKVYNGVCHCLSCQRAFHAYSGGAALPDGPASPTYGVWRTFSAATIADLTDRLRAHIAARTTERLPARPNRRRHLPRGEQCARAPVVAPRDQRRGERTAQLSPRCAGAGQRGGVHGHAVSHGRRGAGALRAILRPDARAGRQSVHLHHGHAGPDPYPCLPVAGEITRFHSSWRDVYDGMQPAARTGLVRPKQLTRSATEHDQATAEFRGLY